MRYVATSVGADEAKDALLWVYSRRSWHEYIEMGGRERDTTCERGDYGWGGDPVDRPTNMPIVVEMDLSKENKV